MLSTVVGCTRFKATDLTPQATTLYGFVLLYFTFWRVDLMATEPAIIVQVWVVPAAIGW